MDSNTPTPVDQTRVSSRGSRRTIVRRLTFWLASTAIGASLLWSLALSGSRPQVIPRRLVASQSQLGTVKPIRSSASPVKRSMAQGNRQQHSENQAVPVSEMRDGPTAEATVSLTPPTGLVRAPLAPRSWTMLGQRPNDSDEVKLPLGSLQQDLRAQEDKERRKPKEERLTKAHSFDGDLRNLPRHKPVPRERPELEGPEPNPVFAPGTPPTAPSVPEVGGPSAPAPAPLNVFDGLDRFNWGAGSPPDTNGDVGPNYFIQAVNTSIGVFRKSDGFQEAAFTFDTFMSQGNFGNLCDTNNFGDPVVLYDTFEDRWIISDFAFVLDGSGNVIAPAFQCIAASKSGDPVTGGWNFYSIQVSDNLNDYPKFGIWPDGLYMSANMFAFGAGSTFKTVRAWAFNKAQMYAGTPTVKVVTFDIGGGDFTILPSNARLQTGTPPTGRPNLFLSTQLFLNAVTVYKFHVDWNKISLSTLTGPDIPISATSWPSFAANVPQPGTATLLDSLSNRAMVQNQYTNISGAESLWVSHTVRRAAGGFAAPRWYQVNVNGGTVAGAIPQAATWDPDGANVVHRWMPSLALDRAGNMALGYSNSSTTVFPSISYAGRLAGDPINTFSKTEQTFFTGTASQTGSSRWGDYSAMTLDPDGCTFWFTTEYANPADQTFNHRWLTKFGSFRYSECTLLGAGGTISGTVTTNPGGAPISGATVQLGARTTTTNGSGNYSFTSIPAGTYPSIAASFPGFVSASASSIVVTDGGTTTQDFSLASAAASACLTDTTLSDFLTGVFTNVDLDTSPGDVTLRNLAVDQQNTAGTTTGTGFGTPAWTGQTFIPAVTGQLAKADIQLFCNGCGATPPNLTLSVRNTSGGLPTGADLDSVTIPGSAFSSGASVTYTASFGAPATLTSGTQYALILRPVSVPAGSGYFWIRSSPSTYASGSRVLSADSGGTWSADTTRDYNFKIYMRGPYAPTSGNLVSSPKDANPAGGLTPIWSTFSWNASVPANTSLKFQLAGSNSVDGPFNFVGPDGTAATFFTTSPVQLSPQFYNFRFLEYKALLATTDSTVSPVLNDVTTCFNDVDCSTSVATITPSPTAVCASSIGNTASGPAGMTAYAWGISNGTITSATNTQSITYTAGASGTVTLSLTVTAPNGCIVANSVPVTINPPPSTPTISGTLSFCTGFSTTLSSSAASGNQWYLNGNPIGGATGQQYVASAAGSYTVQVIDGSGCSSAISAPAVVVENSPPPIPTVSGTTNGTGTQDQACPEQPLTLTATSAGATSYQWYQNGSPIAGQTSSTTIVTGAGTYSVTATSGASCTSAQSAGYVVQNPTPTKPVVTPGGPTTFCAGGSVTLQSNSATGIQWYLNGNPIGGAISQNYVATASGSYTAQLNALGCHSSVSDPVVVTVNPTPSTPTVTPGGPTTFCAGGAVALTSSSATGNQWYLNGNPIGGATGQVYNATASGNYTDVVTENGCASAPSATTTVTVNPIPATPTITPAGSTTFCTTTPLTSSSASGNQWYLNGNPIGGATAQIYNATAAGSYTVVVTANGCDSAPSAATTVTANTPPVMAYPNQTQTTAFHGSITVNPLALPSDNVSVSSIAVQSQGTYTGTITVNNSTGAVSISNAAPVGTHTITIRATDNCGAITDASFTLTVNKADQSITVATHAPATATYNATFTVAATSNSSLPVAYSSSGVCTNVGPVFTMASGTGTCTVKYDQAGDGNYNPATQVTESVTSQKANQSITVSTHAPATATYNTSFSVAGTASSSLTVTFSSSGVCTNVGPVFTMTGGTGTCTVMYDQAGDTNFNAATQVTENVTAQNAATATALSSSLNPSALGQNVTFTATVTSTAGTLTGSAQFKIDGTNSGTPVTLNGSGVATLSTTTLTAGTHTITADYSGDGNFNASSGTLLGGQVVTNRPLISFSLGNFPVNESTGFVTITVNRIGDLSVPVTVDYATDDTGAPATCNTLNSGMASARCDFNLTLGTLTFAATETQKTFIIPITQDSFTEGPEVFTVNLSNLTGTGAAFAIPSSATVTISDSAAPAPNANDDTSAFVRQQYRDFLNRDADASGLAFWTAGIDNCTPKPQCTEVARIHTSAAFFLSIEFQTTGNLVRSFYVATLDRPLTNNMPGFVEFERDTQAMQRGLIVGQGNWQQVLNDNRDAFMRDFVTRAEFVGLYPTTDTPTQYVDKLFLHAAITPTPSERSAAIAEFGSATTASEAGARGRALLDVTQNASFQLREINRSFVQMEYFGYLRRNPNDAPDGNFLGYDFWVAKLNAANGDFISSEMVKAFIVSSEYRQRFGP